MIYIGYVAIGLILAIVALMIYVRVAPSNGADWNDPKVPPTMGPGAFPAPHGFLVQRPMPQDGASIAATLDGIIRATPRTRVVAGSAHSGRVTYETRSKWMGFPDYTTVTLTDIAANGSRSLQIYGRLRFGKSDLGVNRRRIEGWLAQLDGDTPPQ